MAIRNWTPGENRQASSKGAAYARVLAGRAPPSAATEETQRRRALAQALMQQGQQMTQAPREWSSMPVVPRLSAGQALAGVGTQVLGALEAKRTDDAARNAEQQKREEITAAVRGLMTPAQTSAAESEPVPPSPEGPTPLPRRGSPAFSPQQEAALAALQQLPLEAQQQIAGQMGLSALAPKQGFSGTLKPGERAYVNGAEVASVPDKPQKSDDSTTVREYEFARTQGFKGSLQDWIAATRPPVQPVPMQLVTRPGDGGTNQDFGFNPRTGSMTPVGTPYTKPTPLAPKDAQTVRNKLVAIDLAEKQLADAEAAFGKLKGTFSAGPGGGMLPTEAGRSFDAAINRMRDTFTGLTRTPGVGAMSDFETRLAMAKFPERGEYESVTAEQLGGLRQLVNALKGGYTDMLGPDSPPTPAAAGGSPPGGEPPRGNEPARVSSDAEYAALPSGATYVGPDGQTRRKR